MDGAEVLISGLLPPILEKEWGLTPMEISLLGSIYYIGVFLGTICAGLFSDYLGRKKTLIIGAFI